MRRIPHRNTGRGGFALFEALIALALIGLGLLAVTRLHTWTMTGAGDAKTRAEAAHLSQRKVDELRNLLRVTDFSALASGQESNVKSEHGNATYTIAWTVSTPTGAQDLRRIQVATTWTDAQGVSQRLDLNTLVAWDDPGLQARPFIDVSQSIISPTGQARRGQGTLDPSLGTQNPDGTRSYTDPQTKIRYLMDSTGKVLLYLLPKDNEPQLFTTITGRIYFDPNPARPLPQSAYVRVRLSSEGECVFDNSVAKLKTETDANGQQYRYFTYTCYVGTGWYGNVRVEISDAAFQGNASSPTLCVGDPAFNSGVSYAGLQTSAHTIESDQRLYRGFRSAGGTFLPTGVQSARHYGLSLSGTAPFDGFPVPSGFPEFYGSVSAGSATDYFNQDFLLASLGNRDSCYEKMKGGLFTRNAGHFVCIRPDDRPDADQCPNEWPGYQVGTGGSVNYTLDAIVAGNGAITSQPSGIDCGTLCNASYPSGTTVTLTALPATGASFDGWSGACTNTSGTCSVTMNGGQTVTAKFSGGGTGYTVTVSKVGNGTVVSSPGGIGCGGVCAYMFAAGTNVTLTATPDTGSTFVGWTGACSGSATTCTLSNLSANQTVQAQFQSSTCAGTVSGSRIDKDGVVTAQLPSGTWTCNGVGNAKNFECSLQAANGSTVLLTEKGALNDNKDPYTATVSLTWNCSATNVTNVQFK